MPVVEYAGSSIEVNDEGFLVDSNQWTPEVAEAIAKDIGIAELNDQHWKVITFCREDAAKQGTPPGLRRISKNSGVNMKDLYQLFPKGQASWPPWFLACPSLKGAFEVTVDSSETEQRSGNRTQFERDGDQDNDNSNP